MIVGERPGGRRNALWHIDFITPCQESWIREDGTALIAMTPSGGKTRVVRSFANGTETVGGDHVDAATEAAPPGAWEIVVSVWVNQPTFEQVDGGHVLHNDRARNLVTAAMTRPEAKAG